MDVKVKLRKQLRATDIMYFLVDAKLVRIAKDFKYVFLPKRFDYEYATKRLNFLPRKRPRADGRIVYRTGRTMTGVLSSEISAKKGKVWFKGAVPNYIKYTCFYVKPKMGMLDKIFSTMLTIPREFWVFYRQLLKIFPEMKISIKYAKKLYKILQAKKRAYYYYRPFSIYSELKRVRDWEIEYLIQYRKTKGKAFQKGGK